MKPEQYKIGKKKLREFYKYFEMKQKYKKPNRGIFINQRSSFNMVSIAKIRKMQQSMSYVHFV